MSTLRVPGADWVDCTMVQPSELHIKQRGSHLWEIYVAYGGLAADTLDLCKAAAAKFVEFGNRIEHVQYPKTAN